MATGDDWSRSEVEACVADYLRMPTLELNGQHYNKTAHANALLQVLDGRSRGSIEFKHCNISAVLLELGYPTINGYKRRDNYQSVLLDVVETQLLADTAVHEAAQSAVTRPAMAVAGTDTSSAWVPAPAATRIREAPPQYTPRFSAAKRDYLEQEARNRSLGFAGELFVLDIEARRLHAAGKKRLSNRIEHVAKTKGDGLGYDVLSFEESGKERLIEVKTTTFGELTPFFVSRNELARSNIDAERYRLYRVFQFRGQPRLFDLPGSIEDHCHLAAVSFQASLAG